MCLGASKWVFLVVSEVDNEVDASVELSDFIKRDSPSTQASLSHPPSPLHTTQNLSPYLFHFLRKLHPDPICLEIHHFYGLRVERTGEKKSPCSQELKPFIPWAYGPVALIHTRLLVTLNFLPAGTPANSYLTHNRRDGCIKPSRAAVRSL